MDDLLSRIYRLASPGTRVRKLDIGTQIELWTKSSDFLIQTSGAPRMIVGIPLHWCFAEKQKGTYNWFYTDRQGWERPFDSTVNALKAAGHRLFFMIKGAPDWAQSVPGSVCALPKQSEYSSFADFCTAAVLRYGPEAICIWNEPTNPLTFDEAGYYNGCFGETAEAGTQYGLMVKAIYMKVKAKNKAVKIVAGEHAATGITAFWSAARAVLREQYYDVMSFHVYVWDGGNYQRIIDQAQTWSQRTTKPIFITETALMAQEHSPSFEAHKADYLRYWLKELPAKAPRISTVLWYPMCCHNWRNTSLISPVNPDLTAYNIFCHYIRTGEVI